MYGLIMTILLIDSVLIILAVLMQPAKNNSAMSDLSGGGNTGEGHKARGFEAFMQKTTVILGIVFFASALALAWLSSH